MNEDAADLARQWADAGQPPGPVVADASVSTTLMQGLAVLMCFSASERTLSNADLAQRLGLPRPAVSRLCKTLLVTGLLLRDDGGGFRLAPRVLTLAYPVLAAAAWRRGALSVMEDIAHITGGNVTLGVISGAEFVTVQSSGEARNHPHVPDLGITGPLIGSATGRALLSQLSDAALHDKLAECREADPAGYAAQSAAMVAGITRCRSAEGFCTAYGEWRPNIWAAATPLGLAPEGLPVALVCAIPAYRSSRAQIEEDVGPRLRAGAEVLRAAGLFRA